MLRLSLCSVACSVFAALLPFAASAAHAQAPTVTFTPLGDLPGGTFASFAYAVSADGSVVVGYAAGAGSLPQAFRWQNGTLTGLSHPAGSLSSMAYSVSADGSQIVGASFPPYPAPGSYALLWEGATLSPLGDLPGGEDFSFAAGISGDGKVIVGGSHSTQGEEGYRLQGGVMTGLGGLSGGAFESAARTVSADGKVIVGYSRSAGGPEACRWKDGTLSSLGKLPGHPFSYARGLSANGAVIVGVSGTEFPGSGEAFRWTENGMVGLGDLPGGAFYSAANGVSGDGEVIVGESIAQADGSLTAFLWRSDLGLIDLREFVQAQGVSGLQGWHLTAARAISQDGSTIVGYGINPTGFIEAFRLRASNPGGFLTIGLLRRKVTGSVSLQGLATGAAPRSITFEFRPQSGQPLTFTTSIGANQQPFTLEVPPGQYQLAIKGAPYLRQVVPVNATGTGVVSLPAITLATGDTNNDNRVNLTDLIQLRQNYGKTGSSPASDLTGDGRVNLTDLILLRQNYGKMGAL